MQVQKLELDWPEQIRDFFEVINVMSLSLSALSPRCVVDDWNYLNKLPIANAAPLFVCFMLFVVKYAQPRLKFCTRWLLFRMSRSWKGQQYDQRGHATADFSMPLNSGFDNYLLIKASFLMNQSDQLDCR
eukprot:scaffold166875_cov34-Prasinocladus_malaysianus.AAC.1